MAITGSSDIAKVSQLGGIYSAMLSLKRRFLGLSQRSSAESPSGEQPRCQERRTCSKSAAVRGKPSPSSSTSRSRSLTS
jgi:hypothetical protein